MTRIKRMTAAGMLRCTRGPFATECMEEHRVLTITLHATYMTLRLKGRRAGLTLPYGAVWTRACQAAAMSLARERLAKRALRKKGLAHARA